MDTNNIENTIIEKIKKEIESKQNLSDEDVDRKIISEITLAKYLKEDWQIHYAKERIKKAIKPLENVCPFCGNESQRYRPNQAIFFPIAFLIPKFRCIKCKKFFPPIFKNPAVNLIFKTIITLLIVWLAYNICIALFYLIKAII